MDPKFVSTPNKEQELKERHKLWEKTGLLKGIEDENLALQLATLLETQRQLNEQESYPANFLRASIPLVRRVYAGLVAAKIISLQAMISPQDLIWFQDKYGNVQRVELAARGRKLEAEFNLPESSGRTGHNLDAEAEAVAILSLDIAHEIDREVFVDLLKVAPQTFSHLWRGKSTFTDYLRIACSKVKRGANWIVTSPELAEELEEDFDKREVVWSIDRAGTLFGKVAVFVDSQFSPDTILLGFRGDKYDAGYFYCPYTPFGVSGDKLLTRYGKKLVNADYYAKIIVEGHSIQEEQDVQLGEAGWGDSSNDESFEDSCKLDGEGSADCGTAQLSEGVANG